MILVSFSFFLSVFIIIGILSAIKSKGTAPDYLLASHSEKSWLIAFSAVATNNSGYMFLGMIGYSYLNGISVIWIMICVLLGDFCASLFVHKKLRIASGKVNAISFPEVLSKWSGNDYRIFRFCAAIILVVFLSIYAAAQLKAGGKALHVLFGWNYAIGSVIGATIVLFYCLAGGIRASIWTNTAQAFVMIVSMALLFFSSVKEIGGFEIFVSDLKNISPQYLSLFPQNLFFEGSFGLLLFIFGWFFGGFGIVGQPHVMTSFMAMSKPENISRIRCYYYIWYFIFYILVIGSGLAARLIIPMESGFDAELAMPILAQKILPEIFIGLILAGLFSATMSTADSQILSCCAAITNDLLPKTSSSYFVAKLTTIIIAIISMFIAIIDNQSVFGLAMLAWLALACSFGPIITIYSFGGKMSQRLALITMFSGLYMMLIWHYLGFGSSLYEAAPGMILGFIPYLTKKIFCAKIVKK